MLETLVAQGFAGWDYLPILPLEWFDHLFDHN